MCFKFSRRTPLLVLIVGIYLELSIRKGICDDSQLTSSSYQQSDIKNNNKSLPNRHAHQHWNGWEDWLPSTDTRESQQQQQRHNHDIPLSPSEQAKLRYRRNRTEKKYVEKQQQQQQHKSQSRSSKNTTEKTGKSNLENEEDPPIDLKSIRDTAKTLATSLLNHVISSWSSPSSSNSQNSATSESNVPRNSRAVYLDNLGDRPDGPNMGKPEREAKRGVIDWLGRLIGVQGKTLGEFLREYQVHVLYDLAFTFFKWIFFLYAGLLIP